MASRRLCCVVLGLVLVTIAVDSNCPDGWTTHDRQCYFFSHDATDWPSATQLCSLLSGSLVEIDTQDKGNYISNEVKSIKDGDFWIGLTDELVESEWMWAGSKKTLNQTGYSHWQKGEPDNHNGVQNCAYVNGTSGQWLDFVCRGAKNYICEKSSGGGAGVIIG